MQEPILTVFIVTYNRAEYLKLSIQSVLVQTFNNFQLVILDNASTDNTQEIVDSFNDERINYIRHKVNIGGLNNINYAIKNCDTKYYIIFHDDDIMNKEMLENEIALLEKHTDYALVGTLSSYIDNKGNDLDVYEKPVKENYNLFHGDSYLVSLLTVQRGIICPSIMYRNSFMKEKGLIFRTEVGPAADQFLWLEVEKNGGTICRINRELMKYRIHSSQDSQNNSIRMLIDLLEIIGKDIIQTKEQRLLLDRFAIRYSYAISKKYIEKLLSKQEYLIYIKELSYNVSKGKISQITISKLGWLSINIPYIIKLLHKITNSLKKVAK